MNLTNLTNTLEKYWYIMRYWASLAGSSIFFTITLQISNVVNTFLIVFVWFIAGSNSYIITYLLLGRVYSTLTDNQWYSRFGSDIIMGNISKQLLYPQNYFFNYFIASIGFKFIRTLNLFITLSAVVAVYNFYIIPLKLDGNYLGLILFIPISFVMNYILSIIIGSFCFYLKDRRDFSGMSDVYGTISSFLIGTIIPLEKLPSSLGFLQYSPFAWLLNYPVKVYLGQYSNLQTFELLCAGVGWCLILYVIAQTLFEKGLKFNESVGL